MFAAGSVRHDSGDKFQVHGNATIEDITTNAARCLYAFGASESVQIYQGATKPLLRPLRHDPEIHGQDGLAGVEGLPSVENAGVRARLQSLDSMARAIEQLARAIRDTWQDGKGDQVTVVSSGPMTNIAIFVTAYPDLLDGIGEAVCRTTHH